MKRLVGKFLRAAKMLYSFCVLFLRYGWYVLSPSKSNSRSLRRSSQLMVLPCRLRNWLGITSTSSTGVLSMVCKAHLHWRWQYC